MEAFLLSNPVTSIANVIKLHIQPIPILHCQSRMHHGLVFFLEGTSEYIYNEKNIKVAPGSLLYIPKGLEYDIKRKEHATCIHVDFELQDTTNAEMFTRAYSNASQIRELFFSMYNIQNTKHVGYEAQLMSLLYKLISTIQKNESTAYIPNSNYSKISESVEYLKANFFDKSISIPMLAQMSGVSTSYYTKLFNVFFMCSPKKYIMDLKIDMAKKLLMSTYYPMQEISDTCGFTDVYYFCKIFKKSTDMSPSVFRKKNINI